MPVIEVKKLSKNYTTFKKEPGLFAAFKSIVKREKVIVPAVKNISFEINEGELVGFLGPNGAGKTTTLKILSGILHPSSGEAHVLGFTPWERKTAYQRQFALVMGQKSQLWWDLPPEDTFVLNKEIYEVPDAQYRKTRDELVELMDVKDLVNVPARKLSLGERMKCELIAALLHGPRVVYLDEPTIGLDVVSQQKLWEFIKHYNEQRKVTIMLTSHYMKDVERLAKRVIIINDGQLIYDGPFAKIINQYVDHKLVTVTFHTAMERKDLSVYGEVTALEGEVATLRVPKKEVAARTAALLSKLPVADILVEEIPVEDVVRKIFSSHSESNAAL